MSSLGQSWSTPRVQETDRKTNKDILEWLIVCCLTSIGKSIVYIRRTQVLPHLQTNMNEDENEVNDFFLLLEKYVCMDGYGPKIVACWSKIRVFFSSPSKSTKITKLLNVLTVPTWGYPHSNQKTPPIRWCISILRQRTYYVALLVVL